MEDIKKQEKIDSQKNWFKQHPIGTGTVIFFGFIFFVSSLSGDSSNTTTPLQPAVNNPVIQNTITPDNEVPKKVDNTTQEKLQKVITNKTSENVPVRNLIPQVIAPVAPVVVPKQEVQVPIPTIQPAIPKTWHTVTTHSSEVDTKTAPFELHGSQWRISYSCESTSETNGFFGSIGSTNGKTIMGGLFAYGVKCPTSNTSYLYAQSAGQYYLDLTSVNVKYSVTVEDYY